MTGLTRLFAIGLMSLIGVTWRLWTPQEVFPQVPLIQAACHWPGWLDWFCLSVLAASAASICVFASDSQMRRVSATGIAISLAGFFMLDQHRLQPWAWQFFLLAIVLSLANDATARRCWIWLVISIYFWSAVSKLDYTFCHEQGPALLEGLKKAIGLSRMPNRWTESMEIYGSLGIAIGELTVAFLLMWHRSWWLGLWSATAMHVMLLAALGPWGLRHSYGVLTWNVFFIVQNWLLIRPTQPTLSSSRSPFTLNTIWKGTKGPSVVRNCIAEIAVIAAVVWPATEPFGLCDHWLAWAVYSARPGRTEFITSEVMNTTNLSMRAEPFRTNSFWSSKLDIGQWSLDELGVPIYPEHRFQIGVAWSLVERQAFDGTVLFWKPPDRWNGRIHQPELIPVSGVHNWKLERATNDFRWNARPRQMTIKAQADLKR